MGRVINCVIYLWVFNFCLFCGYTTGNNENGVDLYIVDTGIRDTHDEFFSGQVIHELGDGYSRYDPFGYVASHGTHVAGTAGGINYGVSKYLTIYDYRVCIYSEYSVPSSSIDTPCYYNLILTGLHMIRDKLRDNNRRGVINLSLGGSRSYFGYLYEWYFTEIIKYGGIVTVAAGNNNVDACDYSPAFTSAALTVGAADSSLNKASFSNFGKCVDVWSAGVDVYSSVASGDSDYESYPGTSMAAPHICGFVANLLLINPGLTYNDIKYTLIESKQDSSSHNVITGTECDTYECIFPLFNCSKLPSKYSGYDYIQTTDTPIYDAVLLDNDDQDFVAFSPINDYDCNTIVMAIIDDDDTDYNNPLNISISELIYEATDVCATMKTDSDVFISWAYVCIDESIAAFIAWDGERCDSDLYDVNVLKYIYDGMIDSGYWYGVECDNEHPSFENITEYEASVGDDNDCEVRMRWWFAKDWIDLPDSAPQRMGLMEYSMSKKNKNNNNNNNNNNNRNLQSVIEESSEKKENDDSDFSAASGMLSSILENTTYNGNYVCNGFNTSAETYWDVVYAIGTCNWYNGGSNSYIISCDESLNSVTYSYYSGSDCTGNIISTNIVYGGCYEGIIILARYFLKLF